jgi:alpha-1,2-mannosyltransferase
MLHGSPWQVYDHFAFANALKTLFGSFVGGEFLPWLYPPTFLMVVTPLALLPFLIAYFLFVGVSVLSFVGTALRVSGLAQCVGGSRTGTLLLATCPCVFVTAVFGQNSLITGALAALAVQWVDRKPVRAGLCIGLLAIKPQMAMLFPFVLVAAGAWRVMAVAAGSAALFGTLSLLVCGTKTLALFMTNANMARDLILEHGEHFWLASPTAFAALRVSGIPLIAAYGVQGCVAIVAGMAACYVWTRTRNVSLRAAVLAVATLIANPYVWHYELAWLGIALASMVAIGLQRGWRRGEQEVLVLAWLLPLYEFFNRWAKLPQIGVIVLLLMLLVILMRLRTEVEESR